ncbi:hypothetical protein ACFVP3_00635 [Streptomyces sp. NPDC057806]|uniref:hypothetical protein n=1 Tax=Streptomyces sp. NPDC057806 TaxID=3346255 RepID=UPI00368C5CD7
MTGMPRGHVRQGQPVGGGVYATFRPARAGAKLQVLLDTITRHQDQAAVLLSLALGCWLTGRSIAELI